MDIKEFFMMGTGSDWRSIRRRFYFGLIFFIICFVILPWLIRYWRGG